MRIPNYINVIFFSYTKYKCVLYKYLSEPNLKLFFKFCIEQFWPCRPIIQQRCSIYKLLLTYCRNGQRSGKSYSVAKSLSM